MVPMVLGNMSTNISNMVTLNKWLKIIRGKYIWLKK